MGAQLIITKDDIEKGKPLIEPKHIEEIKVAIKADMIDAEDIEDFGRFMFNDLKLVEVEYEEYIGKIIGHYNHLYGTPEKRAAAIAKNKIVRSATNKERDIETEVLICIAVILSINFCIIFSVLVVQFVLRRTMPGYFGSDKITWGFSFIILAGVAASTYLIGYRNHLVRPYCRVGFKDKEEYQNWTENIKIKRYSIAFVLAILFFMLKQILKQIVPKNPKPNLKKVFFFLAFLFDPLFFLLNSILACWPSKHDPGYSLERHERLNSNTLRNLILGEDVIELIVPHVGPPVEAVTHVPVGEAVTHVPLTRSGLTEAELEEMNRNFLEAMANYEREKAIFDREEERYKEEYAEWERTTPPIVKQEWIRFLGQREIDLDEEDPQDLHRMRPRIEKPTSHEPPEKKPVEPRRPCREFYIPNLVRGVMSGGGQAISAVGKFFYRFFYIIAILMCQSVYTGLLVIALFHIISREVSGNYSNMTHIGCTAEKAHREAGATHAPLA